MRRGYVKPVMICERFAANEYVSACGDKNVVYKFECNAPDGPLYAHDSNGRGYDGADYEACYRTHEASVSSTFVDGYIDYNHNRQKDDGEAVKVWLEYQWGRVSNGHATTNLDMSTWETAKS